jgi:Amt family ammonium transporter
MRIGLRDTLGVVTWVVVLLFAGTAFGQDLVVGEVLEEVAAISAGDTAWMLMSSALVLLMTLPGLALFYGGLVRSKNVLSILMQCLV